MSKVRRRDRAEHGRHVQEAEQEKAVLLDEADSFLQNRALAQRSYAEVTEKSTECCRAWSWFKGVFICTTNLFDRIDEAALRRFTFKIQFSRSRASSRSPEDPFVTEALDGNAANLTGAFGPRLNKLQLLTPGDFAAGQAAITLTVDGR